MIIINLADSILTVFFSSLSLVVSIPLLTNDLFLSLNNRSLRHSRVYGMFRVTINKLRKFFLLILSYGQIVKSFRAPATFPCVIEFIAFFFCIQAAYENYIM